MAAESDPQLCSPGQLQAPAALRVCTPREAANLLGKPGVPTAGVPHTRSLRDARPKHVRRAEPTSPGPPPAVHTAQSTWLGSVIQAQAALGLPAAPTTGTAVPAPGSGSDKGSHSLRGDSSASLPRVVQTSLAAQASAAGPLLVVRPRSPGDTCLPATVPADPLTLYQHLPWGSCCAEHLPQWY